MNARTMIAALAAFGSISAAGSRALAADPAARRSTAAAGVSAARTIRGEAVPRPAIARGRDEAITDIDAAQLASAFAKGMPLTEAPGYKVHASRREASGMAEVHVRDTDILCVLEETATIITGGRVVDGQTTARDELRGSSIEGGEPRRLVKGDVMIVPNGMPHQFRDVGAPFLYDVVKVTSLEGGAQ